MPRTKLPPDAHKFSMNVDEAVDGALGGGSSKGKQLDLFDAANVIITTCQTCFRKYTPGQMGKDGRYCRECEAFLSDEWATMKARGVKIMPGWAPRTNGETIRPRHKRKNGNGHATPEADLPIKKIKAMAAKGMTSKRIAAELIGKGYSINYRTIAKMVKGSGRNDRTGSSTKAKRLSTTSKA